MANWRPNPQRKELIPLFSQQCRLRHLTRITAFNMEVVDEKGKEMRNPRTSLSSGVIECSGSEFSCQICMYYYTLHLTTMSAPFYKSEKIQGENPRWAELEIQEILHHSPSLVSKGVVVRIWKQMEGSETDLLVTAWGVNFSGLVPIPESSSSVPLAPNTIVFHMQGGLSFTSAQCLFQHLSGMSPTRNGDTGDGSKKEFILKDEVSQVNEETRSLRLKAKKARICLADTEVKSSYTLPLLLRLRSVEQAIQKQVASAGALRERISATSMLPSTLEKNSRSCSAWISVRDLKQPLLSKQHCTPPSHMTKRQALAEALVAAESLRLCVSILKSERGRKLSEVRVLSNKGQDLATQNKERGRALKELQEALTIEVEHLREWRLQEFLEARDAFLRTSAYLASRRRQLVSELSLIYPILQHPNGGYTICGVRLPNSEDFGPRDEVMVSVALGYVAHAVQMISIFFHVPVRYPVVHLGSRSRISDLVADKIPDGEREFPLFSRAKEKLQFKYGVYLLNKNVAQLRWYCGLPTQDLRATLPNLAGLFYPKAGQNSLMEGGYMGHFMSANSNVGNSFQRENPQSHRRSHSGSSPNLPIHVGRVRLTLSECRGDVPFERGHRVTRSAGGQNELLLPNSLGFNGTEDGQGQETLKRNDLKDEVDIRNSIGSSLSYSLDKGLNEYEVIQRTGQKEEAMGHSDVESHLSGVSSALLEVEGKKMLSHMGSDPILTSKDGTGIRTEQGIKKIITEAQEQFLHGWHLSGGSATVHSDDDADSSVVAEDVLTSEKVCPMNSFCEGSLRSNGSSERRRKGCMLGKADNPSSLAPSMNAELDRLFASVASRTEALASRSTSFNLVRSRQGSTTEDSAPS